ncbi:MAG: hypothetical protein Q9227_001113 [Pyrenula ochraceoflavens]
MSQPYHQVISSSDFATPIPFQNARGRRTHRDNESTWRKLLPVPGLIVTTALAISLLVIREQGWTSSLEFAAHVYRHPSIVGIVVQVLSHALGMLHVYALCSTIGLSARAYFARHSFPLTWINIANALRGARLDTSLPWTYRLPLLVFLLFTLLPGALWAGAITPVIADKQGTASLDVQIFKNTSWLDPGGKTPSSQNTAEGVWTYDLSDDLQGPLINSASSASSRASNDTGNSTNIIHGKLDKTKYNYVNRSYGAGAAVGLKDKSFSRNVTRYQYFENGFSLATHCIYNKSDDLYFTKSFGQPDSWLLQVYEAKGTLPNTPKGVAMDFVAATMANNPAMLAINADSTGGKYMAGIATFGPQYFALNHTQCEVTFTPTTFSVAVDVINKTITVDPVHEKDWFANKTAADAYKDKVLRVLYYLSESLSTALYVNPIGNALMNNIAAVQAINHNTSARTNLTAIENAISSILDDTMVAYSTAQIMLLNNTAPVNVNFTTNAYTFGTSNYIYPIVSLNFVICFVVVVEMLRTRLWHGISKFDIIDVKNVIIAASDAGRGMAMESESLHRQTGTRWTADPDDRVVGKIRAVLAPGGNGGSGVALTLEHSDLEIHQNNGRARSDSQYVPGLRSDGELTPGMLGEDDRIPLRPMGQAMGHSRSRSRESNGSDGSIK